MPKKPAERFTPSLTALLFQEHTETDDTLESAPAATPQPTPAGARGLSEKEQDVFHNSKFAGKLGFLIQRRVTAEGELLTDGLADAREQLQETSSAFEGLEAAVAPSGFNWISIGPRNINGRIKCLAIHPTNGSILYAGAANGGVWKSTNRGQSWQPTMHDEESLAIGALAIDPNEPEIIYAGTGEPVYYLTSSGPLPPGSARLGWFYEGVGVYRSTNGGESWTLMGPIENSFIYQIAVDPFDSNHLLCAGFASATDSGGLCRSIDSGQSWTTIRQGVFTDVLFDPAQRGVAYAAQHNGGILKTTNGGTQWAMRNQGLPAPSRMGRISLTIAHANSNVLYAKIENDRNGHLLGLFRTTSGAEGAVGWLSVSDPGVDNGFVWWCSYIAADPEDPSGNRVFAGGLNVALSQDGGQTWSLVTDAYKGTQPATHADQHALVFNPENNSQIYIANDGGVFRGSIAGGDPLIEWEKASYGLTITQFYDLHISPTVPSMVGGGAQDNGSLISTGGLSWRSVYGGDGGYVAFHPSNSHTVYVQSQNANIVRSTDGGNLFLPANRGIGGKGVFPATVFAIDPRNPQILFAGTDQVYRTTNGGLHPFFFPNAWSAVSEPIGAITELVIAPSTSQLIYVGTLGGKLYRADDGGVTASSFADITPTDPAWPRRWLAGIAVHPTNANTIYVTFLGFNGSAENQSDHVWRGTLDGATDEWTWQLIANDLPDVPVGAIVVDSNQQVLYIATDIGVFLSDNDGENWQPFENGLPNVPVVDLALDAERRLLRAATHGRGMYQVNLANPGAEVDIYIRDHLLDTGGGGGSPSAIINPIQPGNMIDHHQSIDIKVDSPPLRPADALIDGVEFDDPVHPYTGFGVKIEEIDGIQHNQPYRGQGNRVYVQVHNRGWNQANSVTVMLLYADLREGLPPLPDDFWSAFPEGTFDTTHWQVIGTETVSNLLPATPHVVGWDWVLPGTVSDGVCLLVLLDSPQDPLLPQSEVDVDQLTRVNKRVAQHVLQVQNPPVL
ncbi:MAG: hypothetical protein AAF702_40485 [Chloroflexota bacterium]